VSRHATLLYIIHALVQGALVCAERSCHTRLQSL